MSGYRWTRSWYLGLQAASLTTPITFIEIVCHTLSVEQVFPRIGEPSLCSLNGKDLSSRTVLSAVKTMPDCAERRIRASPKDAASRATERVTGRSGLHDSACRPPRPVQRPHMAPSRPRTRRITWPARIPRKGFRSPARLGIIYPWTATGTVSSPGASKPWATWLKDDPDPSRRCGRTPVTW